MKKLLTLIFAALALVVAATSAEPARAQTTATEGCHTALYTVVAGTHEICSQTFQFVGTCTGGDMWNQWSAIITAPPNAHPIFMLPWENQWIGIVGYSITDNNPTGNHQWRIGSGYVADINATLASPDNSKTWYFPSGSVWYFPPAGYLGAMKDLHGLCPVGQGANVSVDFYYFGAGQLPPPTYPPPACGVFATLSTTDKAAGVALSNGNLTATNDGANQHELVRANSGIAPSSGNFHWEWTWTGQGVSGTPINVTGLQDGSTSTSTPVGGGGTGIGIGYNPAHPSFTASGFTSASVSTPGNLNATYGADYNSTTGQLTITPPYYGAMTTTLTATPTTLFPAASMYGSPAGSVTFNFGASSFVYPVPAGYQAGICAGS